MRALGASYVLIIIRLCYILTKKQSHLRQELIHLCCGELVNNYSFGDLSSFLFLLKAHFVAEVVVLSLFRLIMAQASCELLAWNIFISTILYAESIFKPYFYK